MAVLHTLDVEATLTYLSKKAEYDREKVYEIWQTNEPSEIPRTNSHFTDHAKVLIKNIREHKLELGLDTTGFEFFDHTSRVLPSSADLVSTDKSEHLFAYLDECIEVVRERLDADAVVCFDWRYRRNRPGIRQNQLFENAPADREQPLKVASIIHSGTYKGKTLELSTTELVVVDIPADDSQEGGMIKLRRYLTVQEWAEFQDNVWRIRFVNLWRPLIDMVEDAPLAFCDRRTIQAEDFREVDKVHDDYVGENNYLQYREDQQWYYLAQQRVNEPAIFVTWDSEFSGDLPACPPHTSFENPKARTGAPRRESIEVRVLVLHKKRQNCNSGDD